MSYEVLARKLRPMGFDALVGQAHVVRALRHALDAGRLHHAYMFTGTRGVGKTTIARIVAKSLNCEQGVSATPCEKCAICLEIKENRFIDLIEVDAASRTGVDDTRDLLNNAQYLPTRGRYKVYLIDEVHMLSTASFNALLKTLEEPPEYVKFLLATTDPKKVPVTVLSRCLQFQLKKISKEVIADYLHSVLSDEKVEHDQGALDIIARSAAGSMRDALSLTDQAIAFGQGVLRAGEVTDLLGVAGRDEVASLMRGLVAGSVSTVLEISADLALRSADFGEVLKGLMEALHAQAVQSALGQTNTDFSPEELQLYYQIALIGLRDLTIAPDERSGFEMTLLRMLTFAPERDSTVPPRLDRESVAEPDAETGPAQQAQGGGESETIAQAQAPESGSPSQSSDELSEHWFDWVARLSVGGVTRMIAENSVLHRLALPDVALLLDEGHDTLLTPSQIQQLQRALQALLGEPVVLTIEPSKLSTETPAAKRNREARALQVRAEQAIAQDHVVQNLLDEFGGRVDQISPI